MATKELRVMYYTDTSSTSTPYVGRLMCQVCGKALDKVTEAEVEALKTGDFGQVLCPSCEKVTCLSCGYVQMTKRAIKELRDGKGICIFCQWEQRGVVVWRAIKEFTVSRGEGKPQ